MAQNILILSRTLFPSLAPRSHRTTELAKELVRQGHQVTVAAVLGTYDYSDFENETGISVLDLGMSRFEWVSSSGRRNIPIWRKAIVFFLRKLICFPDILIAKRVYTLLKANHQYDRIITIAVPYSIHWGVAYAKSHIKGFSKDIVWISDCGDPFMGNEMSKPLFYFKWVEKWWCKLTDYITVPTEAAIKGYYPEFRDKIRVIPQGFVFDDSILATYEKNPIPTFAYSGTVYPQTRDPRKFLDYLVTIKSDFKFVVYTNKKELFLPYTDKLKNNLELREYVPHDCLIHELSKMDFLINIRNESSVQAPSKLIDYYLTHRPILEISSSFQEQKIFEEFCSGNYDRQVIIDHPERFNIHNIAVSFADL